MIDIHTHGIKTFDSTSSKAEEILKMAEIHGSNGVSAIVPTIYPASPEKMRADMEAVRRAMRLQKGSSAWILGAHLEGPFLNPKKAGALNRDSFLAPTEYNFQRLIEGYEDTIKIITIAPEIDGALRLIREIADMGIVVSMGHSDATFNEAEAGFEAGAKGITHLFNAMRGLHHREPGLSGFGLLNKDIYVEVIGDPYHLHPETLRLVFGIKNPEKIILISDSVKEPFRDQNGTLRGGSMTLSESSEYLLNLGISKEAVSLATEENPKRYLGL